MELESIAFSRKLQYSIIFKNGKFEHYSSRHPAMSSTKTNLILIVVIIIIPILPNFHFPGQYLDFWKIRFGCSASNSLLSRHKKMHSTKQNLMHCDRYHLATILDTATTWKKI